MKSILPIALPGLFSAAVAQNMSFGADNFYRSNNVTVQPVVFKTQYQTDIAGNLYYSKAIGRNATSFPAIVVGHPMGAVKEQSANLYATKLAEQGLITMSIDLPHWGGSDGIPRNAVSTEHYAEAFSAAVDFLGTQALVDRERIGGLGICGSGSFIISAAKIDSRIKAVATVSMYDMGAVTRQGLQHSQSARQLQALVASTSRQRWAEVDGAQVQYTGGTIHEIRSNTSAVEREFYEFYRTRRGEFTPPGSTTNLTTHPTLTSSIKFVNFYPFSGIDTISPRPMMFVSGDQSHSREFSQDAHSLAAQPKQLVWVPGASHTDLYDRVDLIPFDTLATFFRSSLE